MVDLLYDVLDLLCEIYHGEKNVEYQVLENFDVHNKVNIISIAEELC